MSFTGHKNRVLSSHEVLRPDERERLGQYLEGRLELAKARGLWRERRDAVFCLLLLTTGIRVGAACALRIGDVRVGRGQREVRVQRAKGGKPRTVQLPVPMKAVLEEYLALLPDDPEGALFPGTVQSPTPMTRSTGWRRWKKALKAVGLDMKGRGCHAARHGLGLALWKEKGDLRLVAAQLGHTDLRSTMIYTAPLPEDVEEALDATCPLGRKG